jgi:hypothetical protein
MRALRALGALSVSLALASAAPVLAADTPPSDPAAAAAAAAAALLTAKIDTAIASASSYRVAVSGPSGLALDIRSYGADRVKVSTTNGGTASESIVIGTAMYYRVAGGAWKAYPVPAVTHLRKNRLYMGAPDTVVEPLPDRTDGSGAPVGAFRAVAIANSQIPGSMECTYDKATYRPRACSVALQGLATPLQVTYGGWDDPANAVDAPPGVPPPAAPGAPPSAIPTAAPEPHR